MRRAIMAGLLSASMLAVGCADIDTAPEETGATSPVKACGEGKTRSFVVSTLGFTRIDAKTGTVPGFNLDGVVSDETDEASCNKRDFTDAQGNKGVDNQVAALIPDVEKILGNAVDGLIQGAINNGDLLILMDVESAEDMKNDPCVDLTVRIGEGKPTLGTDGVIEAYQTYDIDPKGEVSHATGGKIEDGVLTIGPFELAIPIAIFDVAFTVHVHDALFKLRVDAEDGVVKDGIMGGGVLPKEILDGVQVGAGVAQYIPLLKAVMTASTDLDRDSEGTCQHLSAALAVTAVEAFVRE